MLVSRVLLERDTTSRLKDVLQALDRNIDFVNNIDCVVVDIADTGLADTDFVVAHNLGRVPFFYFWNASAGGIVYDGDRTLWTVTTLVLRCSSPNLSLKLVVT